MQHKRFQINNSDAGIEVQFDIDFDGQKSNIANINIHGSSDIELPRHPTIEYHAGKHVLVQHYQEYVEGKARDAYEIIDTELSNYIIKEIYRIVEEATPRFTP